MSKLKKMIEDYSDNKLIRIVLPLIHFIVSIVLSSRFFVPIFEYTGIENVAYKYFETGSTLREDNVSRILCMIYSYVVAFIIILSFWKWVFCIIDTWIKKKDQRKYVVSVLIFLLLGILYIVGRYPYTITESTDAFFNYAYAKEWLPMYWHAFMTNVIHCACMIVITHPIALSIVPFFFNINVFYYIIYHAVVKRIEHGYVLSYLLFLILLYIPGMAEILTFCGRNYTYANLSVAIVGIFLVDYLEKNRLSVSKFVLLSVLICFLSTWRSEGIAYLAAYPILLYCVYYAGKGDKVKKGTLLKGLAFVLTLLILFSVPDKYGSKKYQDYDYYIINLPGPLAAVLNSPQANVSYEGYEEDIENIIEIVPMDYLFKYGEDATQYWNFDNGRISRQCAAGDKGKDFVLSGYRIILNNLGIYIPYQINQFCRSINISPVFKQSAVKSEVWFCQCPDIYNWCVMYYSIAYDDIAKYNIWFISEGFKTFIQNCSNYIYDYFALFSYGFGGIIRIVVSFVVLGIVIYSLVKRKWVYFWMGGLCLGIMFLVILTAPTVRENYYYSTYLNQFCLILFFLTDEFKDGFELFPREKKVKEG